MMKTQRARVALAFALAATPATVAVAAGPFQYHAVTPCRVFDTRQVGTQTNGSALQNPGPHFFRIQGNCGIPDGAAAVSLNATVIQPNRNGDLRLYPADVSAPVVSTLNYAAFESALANGAIVPLAAVSVPSDDDLAVQHAMPSGPGGLMHLAIDVTGYFE